jgi:uncharacterized protein
MAKMSAASGRRLTVTEVLDLRFLPDEGLAFDEPLAKEWLDAQLAGMGVESSEGDAKLEVEPLGPVAARPPIRIHGAVHASLAATCVRCLEPIRQALEAKLDLTLFARGNEPARERGGEDENAGLTQGELDEGTYEKGELDLPGLVREAILLEIAMNPACEDEAACTDRTNALLAQANEGAAALRDDRWAALRRLAEAQGKPRSGDN